MHKIKQLVQKKFRKVQLNIINGSACPRVNRRSRTDKAQGRSWPVALHSHQGPPPFKVPLNFKWNSH